MLEEYKRVLERRRPQLLEQVRWNSTLSRAFVEKGIFASDDIQDIEFDLNPRNRMFAAISKMASLTDPRTFEKFRQILQECGHVTMAESLEFDRSRIQWDFEKDKEQLALSLCGYIDNLSADLLVTSLSETDEHLRCCLLSEARRRLEALRNSIRQMQQDRDNFRRDLQEIISEVSHSSALTNGRDSGLGGMLNHIKNADERPRISATKLTTPDSIFTKNVNFKLADSINERARLNSSLNSRQISVNNNNMRRISVGSRAFSSSSSSECSSSSSSPIRSQFCGKYLSLSQLEDMECNKDSELMKRLKRTIQELTNRNELLELQISGLRKRLESVEDDTSKYETSFTQGSNVESKSSANSNTLENERQSNETSIDSDSDAEAYRHSDSDAIFDDEYDDVITFRLKKSTFEDLSSQILSHISSTSPQPINIKTSKSLTIRPSDTTRMEELLITAATELEAFRNRNQLIGSAVSEMQNEREMIADRLGISCPLIEDRKSFLQLVLQRLDDLQEFANHIHQSQNPRPPGTYFIRKSRTDADIEKRSKAGSGNRSTCNSGDGGSTIVNEEERKRKTSDPTEFRVDSPRLLTRRMQSGNKTLNSRNNSTSHPAKK